MLCQKHVTPLVERRKHARTIALSGMTYAVRIAPHWTEWYNDVCSVRTISRDRQAHHSQFRAIQVEAVYQGYALHESNSPHSEDR